jgi:hypothetical protein
LQQAAPPAEALQQAALPGGQVGGQPQAGLQAAVVGQGQPQQQQQQQPPAQELQQMFQFVIQQHFAQQVQQQAGHSTSPNMLPVTHVISQLPYLESLKLKGSGLNLESVEPLTQLTQLTRLTMSGCDFDEAALNCLALSLTGLQKLSIGGSELVGDAGLVLVARLLSQLTVLNIRSCSRVTDRGVLQLTRLQGLKAILAEDTAVSQLVLSRALRRF